NREQRLAVRDWFQKSIFVEGQRTLRARVPDIATDDIDLSLPHLDDNVTVSLIVAVFLMVVIDAALASPAHDISDFGLMIGKSLTPISHIGLVIEVTDRLTDVD